MKTFEFTAVDATVTDVGVSYPVYREDIAYQVGINGFTGVTVTFYGRLAPALPWVSIGTANAVSMGELVAYPHLGVALTAATASATPATDKVTVSFNA